MRDSGTYGMRARWGDRWSTRIPCCSSNMHVNIRLVWSLASARGSADYLLSSVEEVEVAI
jgi:hypothetical protein